MLVVVQVGIVVVRFWLVSDVLNWRIPILSFPSLPFLSCFVFLVRELVYTVLLHHRRQSAYLCTVARGMVHGSLCTARIRFVVAEKSFRKILNRQNRRVILNLYVWLLGLILLQSNVLQILSSGC